MMKKKITIDLDKNICSTFKNVVIDILTLRVQKVVLKGGRNTTKSAVACICAILFCLKYQCSALLVVEHSNKATERLSKNILKYMNYLGVRELFLYRKKPDKFILLDKDGKPTIHEIMITGASDPEDIKSMTSEDGGFSYVFLEEAGNFKKEKDIDSIFSTAMRGDTGQHVFVMGYNPPFSPNHFLNQKYGFVECGKALGYDSNYYYNKESVDVDDLHFEYNILVHHSTYLDIMHEHPEWIGAEFIVEAEMQKKSNPKMYEWDKLGKVVANEATVFHNIYEWKYQEKEYSMTFRGLDVGNGGVQSQDPWAYVRWYYDKKNKDLYCLDEFRLPGRASNKEIATEFKKHNKNNLSTYMDSAVGRFVDQLASPPYNLNVERVRKTSEVNSGIHWLLSCNHIYIDPMKTPYTYKEFKSLEYVIDKNDEITNVIQDFNNHFVDSTRYALSDLLNYGDDIIW